MIKGCKSDEGGCDGMAASWSPGQLLNSKSTHLIMTCQGCEWRESEGRRAAEKDGTAARKNAHRLAPD